MGETGEMVNIGKTEVRELKHMLAMEAIKLQTGENMVKKGEKDRVEMRWQTGEKMTERELKHMVPAAKIAGIILAT